MANRFQGRSRARRPDSIMKDPSEICPQFERLLLRGVNWLGDAVMTTPALVRLREAQPRARITLLTHAKLSELWTRHPAVDAVLTFSDRDTVWTVSRKLREQKFQAGVAFPNSHRSALELWLARIPQRVGYAAPLRDWLLTRRVRPRSDFVPMRKRSAAEIKRLVAAGAALATGERQHLPPPAVHHLHQYLQLVAALGANPEPLPPRLEVAAEEIAAIRGKFLPDEGAPCFALNPGAAYGPAKRWPRERFVAAAAEIQRRAGARWVLCGGKSDFELAADITAELARHAARLAQPAPVNLAGRTTLRELCALLKHCRVLLTNDTGPMHLAAAVGTPVVAIFGSTSPELTGPGLPGDAHHHLLTSAAACSPCFRRECPIDLRCMTGISVERVAESVLNACASSV
jgi:heptosyltransferase II